MIGRKISSYSCTVIVKLMQTYNLPERLNIDLSCKNCRGNAFGFFKGSQEGIAR